MDNRQHRTVITEKREANELNCMIFPEYCGESVARLLHREGYQGRAQHTPRVEERLNLESRETKVARVHNKEYSKGKSQSQ